MNLSLFDFCDYRVTFQVVFSIEGTKKFHGYDKFSNQKNDSKGTVTFFSCVFCF